MLPSTPGSEVSCTDNRILRGHIRSVEPPSLQNTHQPTQTIHYRVARTVPYNRRTSLPLPFPSSVQTSSSTQNPSRAPNPANPRFPVTGSPDRRSRPKNHHRPHHRRRHHRRRRTPPHHPRSGLYRLHHIRCTVRPRGLSLVGGEGDESCVGGGAGYAVGVG